MKTLLRDEFRNEIKELGKLQIGSDEYKIAVDGVTKIADRLIEIDRLNMDFDDKVDSRELDKELKLKQMVEEKKDRKIKNALTVLTIGGNVLLVVWGTIYTIKFEESGTLTTSAGRKFVNKIFSWLK